LIQVSFCSTGNGTIEVKAKYTGAQNNNGGSSVRKLRIFISSVQQEFMQKRLALKDWLSNNPLMHRFFEPFLFEDVPAMDHKSDIVYLKEVIDSDIYIGLFGNDYGYEDLEGMSPTEREYIEAGKQYKTRLIFIKGSNDHQRHQKVQRKAASSAWVSTSKSTFGGTPLLG
jgi:hypothetical protein